MTELPVDSAVANSFGLINGTSAPYFSAVAAISLSSVETIQRSTYFDFSAISIDQAISGLPTRGRIFFRGKPSLSPLAIINVYTIINPNAPDDLFSWETSGSSIWSFFIFLTSFGTIYDDLGYSTAPWDTYGNGNDHYFHGITLNYKTLPGIFNDTKAL